MNATCYHFGTGEFQCAAVSDGSMDYEVQHFFANPPLPDVQAALKQHGFPADRIVTPYTFLFVDTGRHHVLVDMGAGRLGSTTGQLPASLQAAGIPASAIDAVVVTHAHPDHVGGTLDDDGRLVYPNASYYISRMEWDFWFSDAAAQQMPPFFVNTARSNLDAIRDRVAYLEGHVEFLPGVTAVPAPGHTPGHIVVSFRSGPARLTFVADTVLHPLHLEHPDWLPVFDTLPDRAAASKQTVFDDAAAEHALVLAQHFAPFPSLGHVEKKSLGWQWHPVPG